MEPLKGPSAEAYLRGLADGMDVAITTMRGIHPEGVTAMQALAACAEAVELVRVDLVNRTAEYVAGDAVPSA